MLLPLSASHAHSLANLRKTPDEVVAGDRAHPRPRATPRGSACVIEVGISTAFGCTIQGRVEPDEVLRLHAGGRSMPGAERVGLADTVGYADPLRWSQHAVRAGVRGRRRAALAAATSTTRAASGIANVFAAWQQGVARFDACLAGIGGCPHAPGASGNVATEDVAYMFASMGVDDRSGLRAADRACARKVAALARRRDAARHAVARGIAEDDARARRRAR